MIFSEFWWWRILRLKTSNDLRENGARASVGIKNAEIFREQLVSFNTFKHSQFIQFSTQISLNLVLLS